MNIKNNKSFSILKKLNVYPLLGIINLNLIKLVNNDYLLVSFVLISLVLLIYLLPLYAMYFIVYVCSFLWFWFMLDDFKLSKNKGLRYLQILFLFLFVFYFLYLVSSLFGYNLFNEIFCGDDLSNDNSNTNITKNKSKNKGLFNPSVSVGLDEDVIDQVKEVGKEVGNQVSNAIEKGSENIANALSTVGVGGIAAYVVKNTTLPPLTKVGVVVGSAAAGSLIQKISTSENALSVLSSLPDGHPPSPTDSTFSNIQSSSVFNFNLDSLFALDPNNHLSNFLFSLLGLNILAVFFMCILTIYLIYIFIYHNSNLELKWIDKILPKKYATNFKSYLVTIIKNWNKSNYFIVIFCVILLLIIIFTSTYYLFLFYTNFDKYLDVYIKYKNIKK
jgi:hypothetical protein